MGRNFLRLFFFCWNYNFKVFLLAFSLYANLRNNKDFPYIVYIMNARSLKRHFFWSTSESKMHLKTWYIRMMECKIQLCEFSRVFVTKGSSFLLFPSPFLSADLILLHSSGWLICDDFFSQFSINHKKDLRENVWFKFFAFPPPPNISFAS